MVILTFIFQSSGRIEADRWKNTRKARKYIVATHHRLLYFIVYGEGLFHGEVPRYIFNRITMEQSYSVTQQVGGFSPPPMSSNSKMYEKGVAKVT